MDELEARRRLVDVLALAEQLGTDLGKEDLNEIEARLVEHGLVEGLARLRA